GGGPHHLARGRRRAPCVSPPHELLHHEAGGSGSVHPGGADAPAVLAHHREAPDAGRRHRRDGGRWRGLSLVRVLLVEDDAGYARLLREILSQPRQVDPGGGYSIEWVATLGDALARLEDLERTAPDIVLLDLGLPDAEGLEAIERVCAAAPRVPVVVLSGHSDIDTALEGMRRGVQEYLVKGQAEDALLPRAIRYAIERKKVQDLEPLLLGVVGHDLRTPLQTIAMASARLLDD